MPLTPTQVEKVAEDRFYMLLGGIPDLEAAVVSDLKTKWALFYAGFKEGITFLLKNPDLLEREDEWPTS